MAYRSVLLVLALLVAPSVALLPTAEACTAAGVPCGRIYPQITIRIPDQLPVYDAAQGAPLELDAELTFRFDADAEGYTVPSPNEPIVVGFEFPRKPKWAELSVEPERIPIPVHDPTYLQADPAASAGPQAEFVYTTTIKIRAAIVDQAVLRDGYDYAKLLVFGKSTESGLYQAGYGIKEIRIAPEGAIHESDLGGVRDVFTPTPVEAFTLQPVERSVAGVTVKLTPPAQARFWEPLPFEVSVSPTFSGRIVAALHDEQGDLVINTQPLDAASGTARFTATLAKPGLHTATLTLLPEGGDVAPVTVPLDFVAGDLAVEGFEFPKSYVVEVREALPAPVGNQDDALAQFERDIPFFAFDTAQSITATVQLVTPNADAAARSAANLQFSILDPEGNLLQQASVDPSVPAKSFRVGSLPVEGWYVLRLNGFGAPTASAYSARVEGAYAAAPIERNRLDGVADATGGLLGLGGRNLTLPVDDLAVWTPAPIAPALDGAASARYALTVLDANGTLVYATGARQGDATFSAPAPGVYRAFAFIEPVAPATAFSPVVRAFTFGVGNGTETTAATFGIEDAFELPAAAVDPQVLGIYALPRVPAEGALDITAENVVLRYVDAEGRAVDAPATITGEPLFLHVLSARSDAGAATTGSIAGAVSYATPVSLVGPDVLPASAPTTKAPIPFLAVGLVLALVGGVAVAVALVRRK